MKLRFLAETDVPESITDFSEPINDNFRVTAVSCCILPSVAVYGEDNNKATQRKQKTNNGIEVRDKDGKVIIAIMERDKILLRNATCFLNK